MGQTFICSSCCCCRRRSPKDDTDDTTKTSDPPDESDDRPRERPGTIGIDPVPTSADGGSPVREESLVLPTEDERQGLGLRVEADETLMQDSLLERLLGEEKRAGGTGVAPKLADGGAPVRERSVVLPTEDERQGSGRRIEVDDPNMKDSRGATDVDPAPPSADDDASVSEESLVLPTEDESWRSGINMEDSLLERLIKVEELAENTGAGVVSPQGEASHKGSMVTPTENERSGSRVDVDDTLE